eukprot:1119264-Pyramimonas_sp.AAC.1
MAIGSHTHTLPPSPISHLTNHRVQRRRPHGKRIPYSALLKSASMQNMGGTLWLLKSHLNLRQVLNVAFMANFSPYKRSSRQSLMSLYSVIRQFLSR